MKKSEKQKLACNALKAYFGFAPAPNKIILLESCESRYVAEYLMFIVEGSKIEYQINLRHSDYSIDVDGLPYVMNIINE